MDLEPEEFAPDEDPVDWVTFQDLCARCGYPVWGRCLSRKELIQALRERRILRLKGPPWVITDEGPFAELNEERLQLRGGGGLNPHQFIVFPRPLPDSIRIRRRKFSYDPRDVVDCDTPEKVQELQAGERLLSAAIAGNLSDLTAAQAAGADLNYCQQGRPSFRAWWGTGRRENALALAALHGHLEVARYLLDQGVSLANPCGSYAWYSASYNGRTDIAYLIQEAGVALELTKRQWQRLNQRE